MSIIRTLAARHDLGIEEVYRILLDHPLAFHTDWRTVERGGNKTRRSVKLKARAQRRKMKRHKRRNR